MLGLKFAAFLPFNSCSLGGIMLAEVSLLKSVFKYFLFLALRCDMSGFTLHSIALQVVSTLNQHTPSA